MNVNDEIKKLKTAKLSDNQVEKLADVVFDRDVPAHELAEILSEITGQDISVRKIRTLRENGVLKFSGRSLFNVKASISAIIENSENEFLKKAKDELGEKYFLALKNTILAEDDRLLAKEICAASDVKKARARLRSALLTEAWEKLGL